MGLKPLEFSDCLLDSPYFRDSIHDHEKELDQTNEAIKNLMKECKNLLGALKNLSVAQESFKSTLNNFKLRYIGEVDTNDELEYEDSFPLFAEIVERVEEERARMLDHASKQLIEPLERFRKEQIGKAKEEKKKFDKATEHVCQLLEAHGKVSPKKKDTALQELDAQLEHELRNFREQSLGYVSTLQEVNETKKFEFVEIMLSWMYGQSTFYHNGHETFNDSRQTLLDLQYKLQCTRDRFNVTLNEAEELKNKIRKKFNNGDLHKGMYARQGYLFVNDKKKGLLGPTFTKHYCMYTKENKILTMVPYNQTNGKLTAGTDTLVVASCVRKPTETSDRRFLFEITSQDRTLTLQALSDDDRKGWLEVMEGREPIYMESSELVSQNDGVTSINDVGLEFVEKCLLAIEKRGLEDQGIYRIAGVSSKFNKLLQVGMDPKQLEKLDLISEETVWEVKTITSAMKQYFRSLTEPLFTFKHHNDFVQAITMCDVLLERGTLQDIDVKNQIERLKELLKLIPEKYRTVLNRLMYHLKLVATHASKNLMQESNLAVVLGPTLMRPKEETMAAIMNIKYQTLVIEFMIKEYEQLFSEGPPQTLCSKGQPSQTPPSPSTKYRAPNPPARPSQRPRRTESDTSPRSPTEVTSVSSSESLADPLHREGSGYFDAVFTRQLSNNITNNEFKTRNRPPVPIARKPGGNSSIKRWRVEHDERPSNLHSPNDEPDDEELLKRWFAEPVSAFTSGPQNLSTDGDDSETAEEAKVRRSSYAIAVKTRRMTSEDVFNKDSVQPPAPAVSRKPKLGDIPSGPPVVPRRKEWKARTLYNCVAENDAELSFNAGAIISNVRNSTEEGWLIGTLNGKTGLVPENYCEKID